MTKIIFHLLNIIFVFLYIYPGSLLGFLIYKDISKQPQIVQDFVVSSNHLYAFTLLSLLGFISYFKSLNLSMNLKVWAVGLAYLCMVLAYPLVIQDGNKKKEMIKAAAVGGIVFGTYAFTLAAVFPKYTADFAFTEFFWGIFIYPIF